MPVEKIGQEPEGRIYIRVGCVEQVGSPILQGEVSSLVRLGMREEEETEDKAEVDLEQWWVALRAKLKSLILCKSLIFLVVSPSLEVFLRKWLRGTAGQRSSSSFFSILCTGVLPFF